MEFIAYFVMQPFAGTGFWLLSFALLSGSFVEHFDIFFDVRIHFLEQFLHAEFIMCTINELYCDSGTCMFLVNEPRCEGGDSDFPIFSLSRLSELNCNLQIFKTLLIFDDERAKFFSFQFLSVFDFQFVLIAIFQVSITLCFIQFSFKFSSCRFSGSSQVILSFMSIFHFSASVVVAYAFW